MFREGVQHGGVRGVLALDVVLGDKSDSRLVHGDADIYDELATEGFVIQGVAFDHVLCQLELAFCDRRKMLGLQGVKSLTLRDSSEGLQIALELDGSRQVFLRALHFVQFLLLVPLRRERLDDTLK